MSSTEHDKILGNNPTHVICDEHVDMTHRTLAEIHKYRAAAALHAKVAPLETDPGGLANFNGPYIYNEPRTDDG